MTHTRSTPRSILVIWPPQVLSYFNAGHHLALHQVAGHLRTALRGSVVDAVDASVERLTWKDIGNALFQKQYDVIAVMNDFDGVDGLARFLSYVAELSPRSKAVAFGRLSGVNPEYFQKFALDAIVHNGDFEAGVHAAIEVFDGHAERAPGVYVKGPDGWRAPDAPGTLLPPSAWYLPTPDELPYARYDELYSNDANKFCGIPRRRELVVPAARGCPIGCSYCEVHTIFGKRERRLTVDQVMEYVEESFAAAPFEYVAFYAPTFTLDRTWVRAMCDRFEAAGSRYPWKCATTLHHLDEDTVTRMGRSGCVRISVGLETLDEEGHDALPRSKQKSEGDLDRLARWCAAAGVELNCFVMVGLPGTTVEGTRRTVAKVHELGGRARPTVYCPWDETRADMTDREMSAFNRQLFAPGTHSMPPEDLAAAYHVVFGPQPDQTEVFQHIPERSRPVADTPAPGPRGVR
ncbi:B12-binding domain-containing radical SAM protein [Streptomyces sp. NPDC051567]|uniref:B12-binding domain-containing radical SAM protein n=1 Tax=Streptomyces sp. NPDC051567 TaxID=3365660 RepID=UPI0037925DDA